MMKEIYKVFRDWKFVLIATQVVIFCLVFLFAWWQHSKWTNFNQSLKDQADAFSAKMEADFQARMAEQRKKTTQMEANFQARMAEERQRVARREAEKLKKAARCGEK